jgi:hypothetical protein
MSPLQVSRTKQYRARQWAEKNYQCIDGQFVKVAGWNRGKSFDTMVDALRFEEEQTNQRRSTFKHLMKDVENVVTQSSDAVKDTVRNEHDATRADIKNHIRDALKTDESAASLKLQYTIALRAEREAKKTATAERKAAALDRKAAAAARKEAAALAKAERTPAAKRRIDGVAKKPVARRRRVYDEDSETQDVD